jgi:hypothetical protein
MRKILFPLPEGEVIRMVEWESKPPTISGTTLTGERMAIAGFDRFYDFDSTGTVRAFSMVPDGPDDLAGIRSEYVSAAGVQLSVEAPGGVGKVVDSSGSAVIDIASGLTADLTVSGAGGLMSGLTEAADTWYALLVIADKSKVNPTALMFVDEANHLAPTLPTGYNTFRRVGWWRNNASSNLRKKLSRGDGRSRFHWYDVEKVNLLALSGGNAIAWTDVILKEWVPPTARMCFIKMAYSPNVAAVRFARIRPKGSTVTLPPTQIDTTQNITTANWFIMVTDSAQIIQFEIAAITGALDIWVVAYWDPS